MSNSSNKQRPFLTSTTPKHTRSNSNSSVSSSSNSKSNPTAASPITPTPSLAIQHSSPTASPTNPAPPLRKLSNSSTASTKPRSSSSSSASSSSSSSSSSSGGGGGGIAKRVAKLKVNDSSPSSSPQQSPANHSSNNNSVEANVMSSSAATTTQPADLNKAGTRRRLSVMGGANESQIDGAADPSSTTTTTTTSSSSSSSTANGKQTANSATSGTASLTRRRLSVMAGAAATALDGSISPSAAAVSSAAASQPSSSSATSPSSSSSSSSSAAPTKKKQACATFETLSKVGFVPFNPNKVNQDRYSAVMNFAGQPDRAFFAVFDGHGAVGHEVSQFCSVEVPKSLRAQPAYAAGDVPQALERAFVDTHERLSQSGHVDCTFSGTTAIAVYIDGNKLWSANAGDSRAVLAHLDGGVVTAVALSSDHKPDRADERERILRSRGRVEACKGTNGEDIGPPRVWLLRQDVPGLAMTRSIGDLVAATVGVSARPEIFQRTLNEQDKFIILASDGVWEFISNQEAVDIVAKAASPQEAVKRLVDESVRRWHAEEEVVDDISAVVVYL